MSILRETVEKGSKVTLSRAVLEGTPDLETVFEEILDMNVNDLGNEGKELCETIVSSV